MFMIYIAKLIQFCLEIKSKNTKEKLNFILFIYFLKSGRECYDLIELDKSKLYFDGTGYQM